MVCNINDVFFFAVLLNFAYPQPPPHLGPRGESRGPPQAAQAPPAVRGPPKPPQAPAAVRGPPVQQNLPTSGPGIHEGPRGPRGPTDSNPKQPGSSTSATSANGPG